MKGQFKIIVPSFNSVKYLPKTLLSIQEQTYPNYAVCVIDDASSFPEQREIISDFCTRNQWKSIFHQTNTGALAGTVEAIRELNCQDEDVIIVIDGDDWLADSYVFAKLNQIYTEEDVYVTWGSFITYPEGQLLMNHDIPQEVIKKKLYRSIFHTFSHLKTFKFRLFREIEDTDLRDATGEYFRVTWDRALMYPMLEMAGYKVRFVPDILYVYNMENPLNDHLINFNEQIAARDYICSQPCYDTLNLDENT